MVRGSVSIFAPSSNSSSPMPRPYPAAQLAATSAPLGSSVLNGAPDDSAGRSSAVSAEGSTPIAARVNTASLGPGWVESVSRRSARGAAIATPGRASICATDSALNPSASKARTRRSACPYSSSAAWDTARVAASAASRVPATSATPSATPNPVRRVRAGRAVRLLHAMADRRMRSAVAPYSPRLASRASSWPGSWSGRRPSVISSRILPSRTTRTRSAYAAARASWVTSTIVCPI